MIAVVEACVFFAVAAGLASLGDRARIRQQRLANLLRETDPGAARAGAPNVAASLRSAAARLIDRLSPAGRVLATDDLARQLLWAGTEMNPAQFAAVRLLGAGVGGSLGLIGGLALAGGTGAAPAVALAAAAGYLLPDAWLHARMRQRQAVIDREVLLYTDLLATVLRVDQTVDAALARVHAELGGIVSAAFARAVWAQAHVGQSVDQALADAAARLNHADVAALAGVLAGSKRYGASIADALHDLGDSLRQRRRERIRERANRLGTLLVLPVSVFLLPALLVLIGLPALMEIRRIGGI